MTILDEIIAFKYKEVEENKSLFPVKLLEKSIYFQTPSVSFKKYLERDDKLGIIAEFKRKSPSRGVINEYASPEKVPLGYMRAGASALSVLTDKKYFGGNNDDLITARKFNYCPILRKDFMVDEYQIIEAKSIGADVILLIAAILNKKKIEQLAGLAKSLGMEVLMEAHSKEELEKINGHIDVIGVNNRNLKNFEVDINISLELFPLIPKQLIKISESGIHLPATVVRLRKAGYRGFLIGEQFMQTTDPGKACENFIMKLKEELDYEG